MFVYLHEVQDHVWFEKTICFLKKKYGFIDLPELINLYKSGIVLKNTCHITIDDGDRSFYDVIYPVLKKHKIPATIFVSSDVAINHINFWFQEIIGYEKQKLLKIVAEVINYDLVDIKIFSVYHIFKCLSIDQIWEIINCYQKKYKPEKKPFQNMTVNELKEVDNSGLVNIGAHTLRHPILANEEMSVSKYEITSSITNLADILGHEINYFAYPNGLPILDYGQREIDILKDIGCTCSFTTVSDNFNSRSDLLNIPRFGVSSGDNGSYIRTKFLFNMYWNKIMELKPSNEAVNRRNLLKLINVTKEE
jgi:peptidoglycan/xylan/chitin deacetylase (PgdA/CDA1 family)